jgi:hypothetical protein
MKMLYIILIILYSLNLYSLSLNDIVIINKNRIELKYYGYIKNINDFTFDISEINDILSNKSIINIDKIVKKNNKLIFILKNEINENNYYTLSIDKKGINDYTIYRQISFCYFYFDNGSKFIILNKSYASIKKYDNNNIFIYLNGKKSRFYDYYFIFPPIIDNIIIFNKTIDNDLFKLEAKYIKYSFFSGYFETMEFCFDKNGKLIYRNILLNELWFSD